VREGGRGEQILDVTSKLDLSLTPSPPSFFSFRSAARSPIALQVESGFLAFQIYPNLVLIPFTFTFFCFQLINDDTGSEPTCSTVARPSLSPSLTRTCASPRPTKRRIVVLARLEDREEDDASPSAGRERRSFRPPFDPAVDAWISNLFGASEIAPR